MIHVVLADAEMEWHQRNGVWRIIDRMRDEGDPILADPRRGRADIVHAFLGMALRSPHRKHGLKVTVHTRQDKLLIFAEGSKVPSNYLEFLEALDGLPSSNSIGTCPSTIGMMDCDIGTLMDEFHGKKVVLSPEGERMPLGHLFSGKDDVMVIIGGFALGDYRSKVKERGDILVSLGDDLLTVPLVLCQVLNAL